MESDALVTRGNVSLLNFSSKFEASSSWQESCRKTNWASFESPSRLLSCPYSFLDFLSFALLSYPVTRILFEITPVISEVTQLQVKVYKNNNDVDQSMACKVELYKRINLRMALLSMFLVSEHNEKLNKISAVKTTWHKTNCPAYLLLRHSFLSPFWLWRKKMSSNFLETTEIFKVFTTSPQFFSCLHISWKTLENVLCNKEQPRVSILVYSSLIGFEEESERRMARMTLGIFLFFIPSSYCWRWRMNCLSLKRDKEELRRHLFF